MLVLFVSNNAYPLTSFGGRSRLDAGMLEVSALRRTEGQEIGRALENLFNGGYRAGEGWARWTTTSFEVDSPSGKPEVGIDGEPVVVDTPTEFKIHAAALRVLAPGPGPHPRGRRDPSPRRGVVERWPLLRPRKGASSSSPGSCGWAACSAGSVSASSGPAETSTAGRWPNGSSADPICLASDRWPALSRDEAWPPAARR